MKKRTILTIVSVMCLASTGCRANSVFVFGNFTSMAIALVMLWSTVNLKRD